MDALKNVGNKIKLIIYMKSLILAVYFLFSSFVINATTYYVSNIGNDSNNGISITTPWQSINKINSINFTAGDNVLFNRGDTWYGTLKINSSGTSANRITFGAYGSGAKPIITGFTTISGWTNYGGGIYSKVVTCQTELNMVTIDGVSTGKGRYPDDGTWLTNTTVGSGYITDNSLPSSPNWTGARIFMKSEGYRFNHGTITSQSSKQLNYTQQYAWCGGDGHNGWGYFIDNDIRTLTTFGEWFYNTSTSTFYMYFGAVDPNSKVVKVASLAEATVTSQSYISIDNISFLGFNGLGFNNCYNTGTLNLSGSSYVSVTNCEIGFSGLSSILVGTHLTVDNCWIHDGNAHALNGAQDYLTLTNSTIENIGLIYSLMGGWTARGMATNFLSGNNIKIQYNIFKHIGSVAAYCGGSNATIDKNLFIDCASRCYDCAPIYMPAYGTNRVITNNIIDGVSGSWDGTGSAPNHPLNLWETVEGIYIDEPNGDDSGTNSLTITGNTVSGVINGSGIKLHRQHDVWSDESPWCVHQCMALTHRKRKAIQVI